MKEFTLRAEQFASQKKHIAVPVSYSWVAQPGERLTMGYMEDDLIVKKETLYVYNRSLDSGYVPRKDHDILNPSSVMSFPPPPPDAVKSVKKGDYIGYLKNAFLDGKLFPPPPVGWDTPVFFPECHYQAIFGDKKLPPPGNGLVPGEQFECVIDDGNVIYKTWIDSFFRKEPIHLFLTNHVILK
jgi:hypothetical protein